MSDRKIMAVLRKTDFSRGWGQNCLVEIDGQKVFVKSVPLTELEMANAYSTKNHYQIPTWYNYGVGSAGFGAFRELAAHKKTTNWVRECEFSAFPLLHHHRILTTERSGKSIRDLKSYVAYWNGSKTVERYMVDRCECKQQLILFLEYLTPARNWISENPTKLNVMFKKAVKSIDFLHQNNMIHFDAHVSNWLTDGKDMFLTDFGLLLDREFELANSELQFFKKHRFYDYSQVVTAFSEGVIDHYFSLNTFQKKLVNKELNQSPNDMAPFINSLISNALTLNEKKLIQLPLTLTRFIRMYQPIIRATSDFFLTLQTEKKSSDLYPAQKLKRMLSRLEVIG